MKFLRRAAERLDDMLMLWGMRRDFAIKAFLDADEGSACVQLMHRDGECLVRPYNGASWLRMELDDFERGTIRRPNPLWRCLRVLPRDRHRSVFFVDAFLREGGIQLPSATLGGHPARPLVMFRRPLAGKIFGIGTRRGEEADELPKVRRRAF